MRYLSLLLLLSALTGCGRKIDTDEPPPIPAPTLVMPAEPAEPAADEAGEPEAEPEPEPVPEVDEERGPVPLAEIDDTATLAVETARRALLGAREAVAGKRYAALAEHCEVAQDSLRWAQSAVPAGQREVIAGLLRELDRLPATPAEVDALLARLPEAPAGDEPADAPI